MKSIRITATIQSTINLPDDEEKAAAKLDSFKEMWEEELGDLWTVNWVSEDEL